MFAPTSRSRMSKIFRDSKSLGKSAGKKWSRNWTFLLGSGLKSLRKKSFFLLILPYFAWKNWCGAHLITRVEPSKRAVGAEHPSPPRGSIMWTPGRVYVWTRGLVNSRFFFLDKSRKLSKIVSVLQSASVERFDVSRMRDFLKTAYHFLYISTYRIWKS